MPERSGSGEGPRYPIPWIATYVVAALVLIAGSFAIVWYLERLPKPFDYSDPDMRLLKDIVLSPEPGRGDFTRLNGGDWRALCLVGWRGDVAGALERAKAADEVSRAIAGAHGAIAGKVSESEFVLVYVDDKGETKALRHPHGYAFASEGAAVCTIRDEPVLALPAGLHDAARPGRTKRRAGEITHCLAVRGHAKRRPERGVSRTRGYTKGSLPWGSIFPEATVQWMPGSTKRPIQPSSGWSPPPAW